MVLWAVSNLDSGFLDIAISDSARCSSHSSRHRFRDRICAHRKYQSQGLVVSKSISDPVDLSGCTIATVKDSTADMQLHHMQAIFHIKLNIVYKSLDEIRAAWSAREIDGAFCWGDPFLFIKEHGGHVLLSANAMHNLGKDSFNTIAVRRDFAHANPEFIEWIVSVMSILDESWINRASNLYWSALDKSSFAASVSDAIYYNSTDYTTRTLIVSEMEDYKFYEGTEQLLLLGHGLTNLTGGFLPHPSHMRVAGDLWSTAQFLVSKKSLARTLPTGRYLRVPHQQVTREGLYT